MLPTNEIIHRYIWLVDTIYAAGEITRDEINRRWVDSPYNYNHDDVYSERMFHRDRDSILEIFGIEIVCDKHRGYLYSIANLEDFEAERMQSWMIDTFAVQNMVGLTTDLRSRVLFEPIPEGSRYLSEIATAMREGFQLHVTYQGFKRPEPHSFYLAPYCLKVFERRWYLVGKPDDHPEESYPRVYALDRVKAIAATEKPFDFPKSFKASEFFDGYFGVDRTESYKPEQIRIKVSAAAANYLRTLPLHDSQVEVERNSEYSVFSLFVAPTYDFVQELRKHGPNLTVLSPDSLREVFARDAEAVNNAYQSAKK